MIKIVFFSGSIRQGSYNTALARYAYALAAQHADVEAVYIDLADYDMPLMNEDIEKAGKPEKAAAFKKIIQDADAMFITTPEYNGFFSPLLKNAIDWASRPHTDTSTYSNDRPTFDGKVAAIAAASPGAMGGIRALPHLRTLLSGIGVHVVPTQTSVGAGAQAFDDQGQMTDERQRGMIESEVIQLIQTTQALRG